MGCSLSVTARNMTNIKHTSRKTIGGFLEFEKSGEKKIVVHKKWQKRIEHNFRVFKTFYPKKTTFLDRFFFLHRVEKSEMEIALGRRCSDHFFFSTRGKNPPKGVKLTWNRGLFFQQLLLGRHKKHHINISNVPDKSIGFFLFCKNECVFFVTICKNLKKTTF